MNHPDLVHKYPTHIDLRDGVVRVGSMRFSEVLCARVGMMRFDVLEPPRCAAARTSYERTVSSE